MITNAFTLRTLLNRWHLPMPDRVDLFTKGTLDTVDVRRVVFEWGDVFLFFWPPRKPQWYTSLALGGVARGEFDLFPIVGGPQKIHAIGTLERYTKVTGEPIFGPHDLFEDEALQLLGPFLLQFRNYQPRDLLKIP